MNPIMERAISAFLDRESAKLKFTEHLITTKGHGHTADTAYVKQHHAGRDTAAYYAAATAFGRLNELEGAAMLRELRKLQVTDQGHPQFGRFRWFREDGAVSDGNASFFILMPFVSLYLCRPGSIPESNRPLLQEMMRDSIAWFAGECEHPALYYPNKIISDGALLLALSSICGMEKYQATAVRFFEQWEDYTERRGWGWGENCSIVYSKVMLNALQTAVLALGEHPLQAKLANRIDQLLDYTRFHGSHEFVPAIRSYNFQGSNDVRNLIWLLSGLEQPSENGTGPGSIHLFSDICTILLFEDHMDRELGRTAELGEVAAAAVPRIRDERVFDDSRAYTWIGYEGRMGSLSRFPVMPGSYQQNGWGLGWQCFPVSFAVHDEQVAYLRWYVRSTEGGVRTHPVETRPQAPDTSLFTESVYPAVETRSAQKENVLLTLRSISGVCHQAEEIADEWLIQRFNGEVDTCCTGSGDGTREWIVLRFAKAAVAVTALNGIPAGRSGLTPMKISAGRENGNVRLRQVLYEGGAGAIVRQPRLLAGWAVVFIDRPMDLERITSSLDQISVTDETEADCELPRSGYDRISRISVRIADREQVSLRTDPYK